MAKRRSKQRDRHQEILEAAAQVITDRGLAETRIQDIAERCGVPPGLILYYFESKDRLLVEALTYSNDHFYLRTTRKLRRMWKWSLARVLSGDQVLLWRREDNRSRSLPSPQNVRHGPL